MMVLDHWDLFLRDFLQVFEVSEVKLVKIFIGGLPCHSYHKGDILTARKNNATKKMM